MPFSCTSIQMPGPYSGYAVPDKVPAFFSLVCGLLAAQPPCFRHGVRTAFFRQSGGLGAAPTSGKDIPFHCLQKRSPVSSCSGGKIKSAS